MTHSGNYFGNARTVAELEVLFACATSPQNSYMGGRLSFEEVYRMTHEEMRIEFNERLAELVVESADWTPGFLLEDTIIVSPMVDAAL